jgi:hypothetical protein
MVPERPNRVAHIRNSLGVQLLHLVLDARLRIGQHEEGVLLIAPLKRL